MVVYKTEDIFGLTTPLEFRSVNFVSVDTCSMNVEGGVTL